MSQIICEVCGGRNIIKENDCFICKDCGIKYSIESIRNMIKANDFAEVKPVEARQENKEQESVPVQASSPTPTNEPLPAHSGTSELYTEARRAKSDHDYAHAAEVYKKIAEKKPHDWEAAFYSEYCVGSDYLDLGIICKHIANAKNESTRIRGTEKIVAPYREGLTPSYYNAVIKDFGAITKLVTTNIEDGDKRQKLILDLAENAVRCSTQVDAKILVKMADELFKLNDLYSTNVYTIAGVKVLRTACDSKRTEAKGILNNYSQLFSQYADEYSYNHPKSSKYLLSSVKKLAETFDTKFEIIHKEYDDIAEKIRSYDTKFTGNIDELVEEKNDLLDNMRRFSKSLSRRIL
jgi:hypothetical protein